MRKSTIAFAAVLGFASATAAWGQQAATGVQGFYGGQVEYQSSSGPQIYYPNNDQDYLYTGNLPFSATASGTAGTASGSLSISAIPSNGNLGLHGFATASASDEAGLGSTGASADFDLYAWDTFQIGGTTGAVEQFQYTLTLDGSASSSSGSDAAAYGYYQLLADSSWTGFGTVSPFVNCNYGVQANGNPCSLIATLDLSALSPGTQGLQTLSGTLTLIGGTTIQLGQFLDARVSASDAYSDSASATFDASNTGWLTLTPIKPGASFTTASGLTYAQSPDAFGAVPEPSSWALMLLGFGAIGAAMRRNRSRVGRQSLT
jgi:hypothetical protein